MHDRTALVVQACITLFMATICLGTNITRIRQLRKSERALPVWLPVLSVVLGIAVVSSVALIGVTLLT